MTGLMAQPLSQQYRIGLNISMHGVMRDIAREQLRAKRQSVASEVKRLYYGILQTQSSLESVEETIRFLRESTGCRPLFQRKDGSQVRKPGGQGQTGSGGAASDSAA